MAVILDFQTERFQIYFFYLHVTPIRPTKFAGHYFLRRPNFRNERVTLFRSIRDFHPLNIYILLLGDENLTSHENTSSFTSVQTYIKDTYQVLPDVMMQ